MSTAIGELALAGATAWTPKTESERVMSAFLSPAVGIVRRLYERMHDMDELYAFSTGGEACDARMLVGTMTNRSNGGCGTSRLSARLGAIGETVERYSGAWVPFEQLRHGSYRELTARGLVCVSPAEFTPFADWQYAREGAPFVPFGEDTPLPWAEGRRLADGALVQVPAQLVYLRADLMDVNPVGYPTSNGLAYGSTVDEALVSGILELVERDAVMITWYQRLSMPLVAVESDPDLAEFFHRHVRPAGIEVSAVDLSTVSGVPTVLAVVRNRSSPLAPLGLGAAAGATPLRAVTKAVCEAVSTRGWVVFKQRDGQVVDPHGDFDETVRTFDDHISLYAHPTHIPATEFLDGSRRRSDLADLPALPDDTPGVLRDALVDRLRRQGVDLIAVNVTSPDVAEAGGHVVKVFSPQLQPLDCGYRRRFLGTRRLRELPVRLGLRTPAQAAELNPLPHPFP
ncbi:YcaO-like family protein [Crossiella sp. SN42]|uniref:YcaO-like family protein n=1 Tax=Crossiella sp. SN42 TaxID=2944808 RepID=UPI00207D51A3|nr:YcaO-like family protein [Crossiella sp. SN42]MCO1574612.1 YcaO-like family protein [Crossiella sp. SN42]